MDRMLYVAMNGAHQTLHAQAVVNHNLANVASAGFRQDIPAFRSQPVFGNGFPTRAYAMAERAGVNMSPGPVTTTDRDLDIAVDGQGWIAVRAPDGSQAYTRSGNLQLSPNGLLTTGAGYEVLGNGGPITIPPAEKLEIGADGTISIRPLGELPDVLTEVNRILLVDPPPENLYKGADGLMRLKADEPALPDARVRLVTGALEGSNVNPATALVNMISLARQFEMQVKLMSTAEENARAAEQLLRME